MSASDMKTSVEDPVCRTTFDVADAAAQEEHEGWAYFFCSIECRQKFIRQPAKFASKPTIIAHKTRRSRARSKAGQP
ncbi:MAG: hypothetical protein CMI63_05480 [Parvularcula sp.]|uniref:YHS domain-containing protein n=2 Tax=Hyphococcus aureus TaxID=2666033 RepID=A0ABW1KZR0_9PROT|nr:hypothetical protein [Parvularcula sp.]